MNKKIIYLFSFILFSNLVFLIAEDTPAQKKYFEDFLVTELDKRPIFYREIPEHQLSGKWQAAFTLDGVEVRRNLSFQPDGTRIYYEVRYDERKRPYQIISANRTDRLRLELVWQGERVMEIIRHTSEGFTRNPKSQREIIERNADDSVKLVSYLTGDSLTYGENHYRRSNETRVVSYFPNGRLRSIRFFVREKDRLFRKEKLMSEKNVSFEMTGEKSSRQMMDPRITDGSFFTNLLTLPYDMFAEPDSEIIYQKTGTGLFDPGQGDRLVREFKMLPRYETWDAGILKIQIVLGKGIPGKPTGDLPFTGFYDGFDWWGAYRVHRLDPVQDDVRMTEHFEDGLLRESRWLNGETSVKTLRLEYYPNRQPLREITLLQGKFFSQKVFHSGELPEPKPEKKAAPKAGVKV